MTSVPPPTEFFPGINFNASFYNLGQSAVTLDYLNSNFLRSTGYAISRAQYTLFNGSVNIQQNLDVSQNINAGAYALNGVPVTFSQWTTSGNDIYYNTGNVGIGKTNPAATYKLDVSGNINADKIFRAGTELTQYTDTNVRTVLSTSAGTNMTWNNTNNTFNVGIGIATTAALGTVQIGSGLSITPSGLLSANANIVGIATTAALGTVQIGSGLSITPQGLLSANAVGIATTAALGTVQIGSGLSITPQGLLSANAVGIATTAALGTVQIGSGLSITGAGLLSANAATPYTLPIASNGTLGGVKPDVDTIIVNPSTGLMSLSGNDISLNGTANRAYGWLSSTSALGRAAVAGSYSTNSVINDVVLRSANNLILQSGVGTSALIINTSNQAFFRNALCIAGTAITAGSVLDITGNSTMRNALVVGGTTITSGYTLDVKGDVITSGNINLANTSTSLFWGGTNSNLGRAGLAGQYSTSSAIDDIVLRSSNKLILQSGVGAAGVVINTANNVGIGIAAPNSTLHLHKNSLTSDVRIQFTDNTSGTSVGNGVVVGKGTDNRGYIWNYANQGLFFGTNAIERVWINADGSMGTVGSLNVGSDLFITSSRLVLRGTSPTLYLRDTDNRSGMIHMNSNIMYFLNASGNDSETWTQQNGQNWCLQLNMNNNDATFGGAIISGSYIAASNFLQGSGGGGGYRILRYDNWVRLQDTGQSTHLDFAAGRLYSHFQLDVQGVATFNNQMYLNSTIFAYGSLLCRLSNISSTNTDYVCVSGNTAYQSLNDKFLYIANGTFTGFHRNYTDDELFDVENPEIFKNSFVGYIVISSGKIKTDYSSIEEELIEEEEKLNNKVEWKSAIDKEGIFIEDALPIIKLSRVKKDKRVFGVLGDPKRNCNSKERLIVNSVGEGAICVCNTNGNIENGDYIQSSDVLGHGEKQDDDILHNYTVAKATIDCNFELNSPYYECIERPDGIRTAFIACTYHCG
jgi:hypothetical protein